MHVPVMLNECIERLGLDVHGNMSVSVDCTLGYGGHTLEMIKCTLNSGGIHIALDQDPIEIRKTEERVRAQLNTICTSKDSNNRFLVYNRNFRDLSDIIQELGLTGKVTSLLADLGYSSMQIDDPARGFTYKFEGPLDMRMDPEFINETASQLIDRLDQLTLASILRENSDEEFADNIACGLISSRPVTTTSQLAKAVKKACIQGHNSRRLAPPSRENINSAIARTMQALRIEVNREFSSLDALLGILPKILSPNGRAVFLTFHSGEDRRVKKSFKSGFNKGEYSSWSRDVTVAGPDERRLNPRSKCAKLRWVIRSASVE
jgi:16S rRNA (cytosine1402-N4)-methyltransferase